MLHTKSTNNIYHYYNAVDSGSRLLTILAGVGYDATTIAPGDDDYDPNQLIILINQQITPMTLSLEGLATKISEAYIEYLGTKNPYESDSYLQLKESPTVKDNILVLKQLITSMEIMGSQSVDKPDPLREEINDLKKYAYALDTYGMMAQSLSTVWELMYQNMESQLGCVSNDTEEDQTKDTKVKAKTKKVKAKTKKKDKKKPAKSVLWPVDGEQEI